MKTFKEFRQEKIKARKDDGYYPSMETSFGQHSVKKPDDGYYPSLETSFGSHSTPKKQVNEDFGPDAPNPYAKYKRPLRVHDDIHENVAPLDLDKTSSKELAAVVDYTDDSSSLNRNLYNHHNGLNYSHAYHEQANTLTELLDKHKTTEDTHVFTGIRRQSPSAHFTPVNGVVPETANAHLPSFTSTSTDLKQAAPFSGSVSHENDVNHGVIEKGHFGEHPRHVLKIHLPKGTSAASLKDHSFLPEEKEILLNRGHNIEIHHKPEHLGNGVYLWNAKIIGHTPKKLE